MKSYDEWYEDIEKQVGRLRNSLTERNYKKYKLRMLLCVAERVAQFSPVCEQCQILQQDVVTLAQSAGNTDEMYHKESRKQYFKSMNRIISHLQKQHKLVTEGYYMGICIVFGTAIGLPIGIANGNVSLGLTLGLPIGLVIGLSLDTKAKKEGRVLHPREIKVSSKTGLV